MEYSVADTSEVQWVSAVLLQIFNCSLCMKQHMFEETKFDRVIRSKKSFKPAVIVKEEA